VEYSKEIRETILVELSGMPSRRQVSRWVLEDEEFKQAFREARMMGAEANEDEVRLLIKTAVEKPELANACRVAMDGYKWLTGVTNPSKYGAKQEIHVTEEARTPQEVSDRIKALEVELTGLLNQTSESTKGELTGDPIDPPLSGAQTLDVSPPRAPQSPVH
jgi:hypothetical protein